MSAWLPIDSDRRRALVEAVRGHTALGRWLPAALAASNEPLALDFRAAYAATARKLGVEGKASAASYFPNEPLIPAHWTLVDVARWLLLMLGHERLQNEQRPVFLDQLFRGGELGEQVSFLRTLSLVPDCGQLLDTAVEACRTNAVAVFEAIACENPFPAAHFPELSWNQMVIKAIFLELSVRRIQGLETRVTPELARMAEGLKSERAKAGRSIPEDIDIIVALSRPS